MFEHYYLSKENMMGEYVFKDLNLNCQPKVIKLPFSHDGIAVQSCLKYLDRRRKGRYR